MRRRLPTRTRILLTLSLLLLLPACAKSPLDRTITTSQARAQSDWLLREDLHVPESDHPLGCGTQALGAAAQRLLPDTDARQVADSLPFGPRGGTPVDVLLAARALGLQASIERGSWERLLQLAHDQSAVALVLFDVTVEGDSPLGRVRARESFHWSALSGAARDEAAILLATTRGRHHPVTRDLFEQRWAPADNCLIILRAPEDDA